MEVGELRNRLQGTPKDENYAPFLGHFLAESCYQSSRPLFEKEGHEE